MASNTNYAQKLESPNITLNSTNHMNKNTTNYSTNIDTFTYDDLSTSYDSNGSYQVVTTAADLNAPNVTTNSSSLTALRTDAFIANTPNYMNIYVQSDIPAVVQAYSVPSSLYVLQNAQDYLQNQFIGPQQQDFIGPQQQDFIGPQQQDFIGPQNQDFIGPQQQDFIVAQQNSSIGSQQTQNQENFVLEPYSMNDVIKSSFNGGKGLVGIGETKYKNAKNIFTVDSVYKGDQVAVGQMEMIFENMREQLSDDPEALSYFDNLYNNPAKKAEVYKLLLNKYNSNAVEYNGYVKEWNDLTAQMNRDLAGCQTAKTRDAVYEDYYKKYTELQEKMDKCKSEIAGEGNAEKIDFEKTFLGNSSSAMKQYGSEAGTQALLGFLIKETSVFTSSYINACRDGEDPDEALATALCDLGESTGKNALTSIGQGSGYFVTMLATHGNKNAAGVAGLIGADTFGLGYDYFTETDPDKRKDVLIKGGMKIGLGATTAYGGQYVLPNLINSGAIESTKLAPGALPFSGATLYSYGTTAGTVGSWFFRYDDLGEWAANENPEEASAMFLNTTAYTIGDGIEVFFTGKTTGTIGTILSIPANYLAKPCAKIGVELGYVASDLTDAFGYALDQTCSLIAPINHDLRTYGYIKTNFSQGIMPYNSNPLLPGNSQISLTPSNTFDALVNNTPFSSNTPTNNSSFDQLINSSQIPITNNSSIDAFINK